MDRSDRQDRRRQGKSDPLDAVSAARAAQSGRARGAPKGRDGAVEAIRALMVAKRSARSERTQTINQARALIVTGPDDLRARFAAAHGRRPGQPSWRRCGPGPATSSATPPGPRCASWAAAPSSWTASSGCLDELIVPLVTARAPGLLALHGVGPDTAALLLIAAGRPPATGSAPRRPGRTCAPPPRSRPRRGKSPATGSTPAATAQANHALWRIVITRMSSHAPTRAYVERRTERRPVEDGDHPLPEALRRPRRSTATSAPPTANAPDPGDGLTR